MATFLDTLSQVTEPLNAGRMLIRQTVNGETIDSKILFSDLVANLVNSSTLGTSVGQTPLLISGTGGAALPAISGEYLTDLDFSTIPVGNSSATGTLKLSSSTTSTSGTGGGFAATPSAINSLRTDYTNLISLKANYGSDNSWAFQSFGNGISISDGVTVDYVTFEDEASVSADKNLKHNTNFLYWGGDKVVTSTQLGSAAYKNVSNSSATLWDNYNLDDYHIYGLGGTSKFIDGSVSFDTIYETGFYMTYNNDSMPTDDWYYVTIQEHYTTFNRQTASTLANKVINKTFSRLVNAEGVDIGDWQEDWNEGNLQEDNTSTSTYSSGYFTTPNSVNTRISENLDSLMSGDNTWTGENTFSGNSYFNLPVSMTSPLTLSSPAQFNAPPYINSGMYLTTNAYVTYSSDSIIVNGEALAYDGGDISEDDHILRVEDVTNNGGTYTSNIPISPAGVQITVTDRLADLVENGTWTPTLFGTSHPFTAGSSAEYSADYQKVNERVSVDLKLFFDDSTTSISVGDKIVLSNTLQDLLGASGSFSSISVGSLTNDSYSDHVFFDMKFDDHAGQMYLFCTYASGSPNYGQDLQGTLEWRVLA